MSSSTPATATATAITTDASGGDACHPHGSAPAGSLADAVAFFDRIYAEADGDTQRIPWSDGRAHPALVRWLDVVAPCPPAASAPMRSRSLAAGTT